MKKMPKINRMRIANIQYDGKVIKDLLLNCYGGENVLINLANGGGKSVLVQLLQQPLLPESKIHGREIYSYLSQEHPSYILIEWKLDNTPKKYLLTGIVISRLFSSEDRNKARYFTFLHSYTSRNEWDIQNIPLIVKEEEAIRYKSYDAAMKLISEQKNAEELYLYGREDQKSYREKLAEYGIFTNEWKVLAKMNENEGGVDELFKDCKTSDSLINKWILKVISDGSEIESKELKEMFSSLMEEIIEQEENITQKEIFEEFKSIIEKYEDSLKQLLEKLEEEKTVQNDIYGIYLTLKRLSKENQNKIEEIEKQVIEYNNQLEEINYEELSEEYYHHCQDLEVLQEQKEQISQELDWQKNALEKAKHTYRIQKAAYLYQKEKKEENELKALELARENLENQGNKDTQLLSIEYTLQEKYKEKGESLSQEVEKLQEEEKQTKKQIKEEKEKQNENQERLKKLSLTRGTLQEQISQFEKKEKELWDKMGISLTRNLLNELEDKEINTIKANWHTQIISHEEQIKENQEKRQKNILEIEEMDKQEDKMRNELEELTQEMTKNNLAYQEFQKQEKTIKEILRFHHIPESNIFQKDENHTILQEKKWEMNRKIESCTRQIEQIKQYLLDIEQGGIHTSHEMREMLKKAQIDFITGEDYLREQNEEYQKELLSKNPLLPYCYIVTQEELERIKQLEMKEETDKLTLIITYQGIDKPLTQEKRMVQWEEMYFLNLYHQDCFFSRAKEYQKKLQHQLETLQKRKKEQEEELSTLEKHIHELDRFTYQEKDKKKREEMIVFFEREIEKKKEEIATGRKQKEEWQKENESRQLIIEEEKQKLQEKRKEESQFLDYLTENEIYCQRKQEEEKALLETARREEEIIQVERNLEELETILRVKLTQIRQTQEQLTNIQKKQVNIPHRENQEMLPDSIEELEAKYEQLTIKYDQDRKQIQKEISTCQERKLEWERERKKQYGDLSFDEYALLTYAEELEDLAKEQQEEAEKVLQEKLDEMNKIQTEYTRKSTQLQNVNENLKKLGKLEPISASQIKGKYQKRREEIKANQIASEKQKGELQEQNITWQKQINHIERTVEVENIGEEIEEKPVEGIELISHLKKYKQLQQENRENKDDVFKKQLEINNHYKAKHRILSTFLETITLNNAEGEFDDFYYLYEKLVNCLEKLTEYIHVLALSLQNIEQDKKNILQHAVRQGIMLYQEMKAISDSSKIRIGERYIQILKIEIPSELNEQVEQRIENHIQYCIQTLREECQKSEDKKKTIDNRIAVLLSDRQLLNLTLDCETIKVKLYKFDIQHRNSGLRQWEEVIVGNSGGQRFIACFALLSALIEYTRKKELEARGEKENQESSKVFILDNPFGKTSSSHLLEPMMEISKKFNIQMICLSDLSQSSITDKFTLIYQLALRGSKYTNKSFLNLEKTRINGEVNMDASLEQVYLRNYLEQISFLP